MFIVQFKAKSFPSKDIDQATIRPIRLRFGNKLFDMIRYDVTMIFSLQLEVPFAELTYGKRRIWSAQADR